MNHFAQQIQEAKKVSMIAYLQSSGWNLLRAGTGYKLKQNPSVHIYPLTNTFKDYGGTQAQGDLIDFIKVFESKSFQEAVSTLTGKEWKQKTFTPQPQAAVKPKPFVLPIADTKGYSETRHYLQHRKIDKAVIAHCIQRGLIYQEEKYKNAVYVGKDKQGKTLFASVELYCQHKTGQKNAFLKRAI